MFCLKHLQFTVFVFVLYLGWIVSASMIDQILSRSPSCQLRVLDWAERVSHDSMREDGNHFFAKILHFKISN